MRYAIFKRGGYKQGVIGATGGDLTGRAILSRNPMGANEASTKNYVDVKFDTLPIDNIASGVIPGARVPEYSGDIVKLEGSSSTTVKTTTVAEGTYTRVTVNIKGQVTSGASLVEADVPVLPWGKISTGKPTTLAGYGITNALSTSGGTILGSLKVSEVNVDPDYLANKSFVDMASQGGVGTSTGCVIYRNKDVTPIGFLRCNGAVVSKSAYPALYSVVGDKYTPSILAGGGRPWQYQHDFNTEQTQPLTAPVITPNLMPEATYGSINFVTKNRIHIIGGWDANNYIVRTYSAPLNSDGSIGTWVRGNDLPTAVGYGYSMVMNNRVYIFPSWFYMQQGNTNTMYAPINNDGTLGAWVIHQTFPANLYIYSGVVTKSRVYVYAQWLVGDVYVYGYSVAPILQDGNIGQFGSFIQDNAVSYNMTAVIKDRVYSFSSYDVATGLPSITYAIMNEDGSIGPFGNPTPSPSPDGISHIITTRSTVYAFGAWNINGNPVYIYYAPINADGSIGTWATGISYTNDLFWSYPVIVKNKIYVFGYWNGSVYTNGGYTFAFAGGMNDYSQFYDGTFALLNAGDNFKLPTINPKLSETYAFIKI